MRQRIEACDGQVLLLHDSTELDYTGKTTLSDLGYVGKGHRQRGYISHPSLAVARLGGHQNRKHDHPPGWLVLWRGWGKLENMILGVLAMERARWG